jgi:hypothetical protein
MNNQELIILGIFDVADICLSHWLYSGMRK